MFRGDCPACRIDRLGCAQKGGLLHGFSHKVMAQWDNRIKSGEAPDSDLSLKVTCCSPTLHLATLKTKALGLKWFAQF